MPPLLFNLLSEFRRASGLPQHKEPATLRSAIFLCGAELKRQGDELVLLLSTALGWPEATYPARQQYLGLVFFKNAEVDTRTRHLSLLNPPRANKNPSNSFGIQVEDACSRSGGRQGSKK